jgi:hypothetical protein
LHNGLFAALAEAVSSKTPVQKAAENIAVRLPDDQWGALARFGLEELARALREAGKRYPVLALPRSRGIVLAIQDALRSRAAFSLAVAWLVRATGPGKRGETLRLKTARAVLGRAAGCDLVIGEDPQIAEQHAVISEAHGEFAIEPVGDAAVKVEDIPVTTAHSLGDGDTIEIGQGRYVFKCVTTGKLTKSTGNAMKPPRVRV